MHRLAVFAHRHRWPVVAVWVVVAMVSFVASSGLGDLLTNRFDLPGTDSKRVDTILQDHFGERGDSSALVVGRADGAVSAAFRQEVQAAAQRAAGDMPRSSLGPLLEAEGVVYVAIGTPLDPDQAVPRVDAMREAMQPGHVAGGTTYLSGDIAITHDLQPVFDAATCARRADRRRRGHRRPAVHLRHAGGDARAVHLRADRRSDDAGAGLDRWPTRWTWRSTCGTWSR